MNVKEKLKALPATPGIYLMKDSKGSIIYVGKSKNLKARVSSYFHRSKNHSKKVEKLVQHVKDFEIIETDTEFEALLLEAKYIHDLQPLYNRLMKNPKSYPYIIFTKKKGFTELKSSIVVDEAPESIVFGPYSSKNNVERAITGLKDALKINCTTWGKPCLNYSLGKCIGMCLGGEKLVQYEQIMNRLIGLFSGTDFSILRELEEKMEEASRGVQFEKAAELRNTLEAVQVLLKKEQMLEFAQANVSIGMVDRMNAEKGKFFFIKRNTVFLRKRINLNAISVKEIIGGIESVLPEVLKSPSSPSPLKQEEIDEAAIIYAYLQKNNHSFVLIPDEWLFEKQGMEKLEQPIRELFRHVF